MKRETYFSGCSIDELNGNKNLMIESAMGDISKIIELQKTISSYEETIRTISSIIRGGSKGLLMEVVEDFPDNIKSDIENIITHLNPEYNRLNGEKLDIKKNTEKELPMHTIPGNAEYRETSEKLNNPECKRRWFITGLHLYIFPPDPECGDFQALHTWKPDRKGIIETLKFRIKTGNWKYTFKSL